MNISCIQGDAEPTDEITDIYGTLSDGEIPVSHFKLQKLNKNNFDNNNNNNNNNNNIIIIINN